MSLATVLASAPAHAQEGELSAHASGQMRFVLPSDGNSESTTFSLATESPALEPFRSLRRVALSVRNTEGDEVFRAMFNPSSICDPIPPGKFGVFLQDERGQIDEKSVGPHEFAGQFEELAAPSGALLAGTEAKHSDGVWHTTWVVRLSGDLPPGLYEAFSRAIPRGKKTAPWVSACLIEKPFKSVAIDESDEAESPPSSSSDFLTTTTIPDHAVPLEEALELEKSGHLAEALRRLSEAYGVEAPVQAYYDTLDRKKMEILEAVTEGTPLDPAKSGQDALSIRDFRVLYERALMQPDVLRSVVDVDDDLPPARYFHLQILGSEAAAAIQSPDPWLVSAALFQARKGRMQIGPAEVIRRWESRPDLWDDVCTQQALLYFASLDSDTSPTLEVANEDIESALARMQAPPDGRCLLQPLCFWQNASPLLELRILSSLGGLTLQTLDKNGRPIGEGREIAPETSGGCIAVERGSYAIRHVAGDGNGSSYGGSKSFAAQPGRFVRVWVGIQGGV
ncbi:hypothetical protein JW916_00780 [Candidatus Sumerlaeota bacterium]|nr:hypothetical protein [Candidatus Sumerlaeota bacterium]